MTDEPREEQQEPAETYRKVDRRDWLREEEPAAEAAPEPEAAPELDEEPPAEPMPPLDTYALLRMCVGMFMEQAWVQLGLHLAPGSQETTADLLQAKLAIDTVAHMRAALQGNLTPEEERSLDQALASLRMNYVQRA